ncbi:DNA damage-inducible protein D [Pseudomonas sp. UBA2684]|uniref:DNA damage-inducible protein D n=1 Tax=Pseudomonas sp. UBA2684 TaxID=1947311 RepID=UPI000E8FC646|nr:DNA damage-inducible protein D [Pseudomonas sp. UBA2684]HBX55248.1 DNA damage-inducible protein D [Pseudomonas sp.]|tara:strand:- start:5440 stop:6303 length:864 start_codon:yes stop_codon:yes gene_type:complete
MKKDLIVKLHAAFEDIVQRHAETATEFWLARELQPMLGYARWENFAKIVDKAKASCEAAGNRVDDHFRDVTKMVSLGSGSQRAVEDIALTRYACYLIAQNGDPSKEPIAFAQTYFALQTRKQELIEQRLAESERLVARKKLTASEKQLSSVIYERLGEEQSFARIRSRGDQALFGGVSTQQMKERLGVPQSRPLADFLPTITIKAKDFANEITNFNIKKDDLDSEREITNEHVKNNADVRALLGDRGIVPEQLPAAEDLKKIERRHTAEAKKLPKTVERLDDESKHE